ncbi:MerR family transcriptional regulator [Pseudoroseicyclus sp. CXY001]|uniref:MerR family transcriptional regulator n=1 Tax=Pseudoroseicyclus sp. CXY001 TaxID=3242492 RepID=UPI00358DC3EB
MAKSKDAFRTISEVADWLETPAHVLRFWESKFSQVRPVKRAGGRRYYRPDDMALLGGIKALLHNEGMTIKGVQKLLREQGAAHVAALAPPHPGDDVFEGRLARPMLRVVEDSPEEAAEDEAAEAPAFTTYAAAAAAAEEPDEVEEAEIVPEAPPEAEPAPEEAEIVPVEELAAPPEEQAAAPVAPALPRRRHWLLGRLAAAPRPALGSEGPALRALAGRLAAHRDLLASAGK